MKRRITQKKKRELLSRMRYVMEAIVDDRGMKSEISGEDLRKYFYDDMYRSCFAHCVPKSGPPALAVPDDIKEDLLRFNKDNIMLVTPYEHFLLDTGTKDLRWEYEKDTHCSFSIFYKRKAKIMKQLIDALDRGSG